MNIHQLKKYWQDKNEQLYVYRQSQLDLRLTKKTIDFLTECGLPDSCAPGLMFNVSDNKNIPTPNQFFNIHIEGLDRYLVIGNNGCGDPICIDLNKNDEIVFLNHDNYFERIFMNSSLNQLAESIILYENFYKSLNPKIENKVFTKRKFSDIEFSQLRYDFLLIDNQSISDESCWNSEIDCLLWERDNE